jgi:hypothetical protein
LQFTDLDNLILADIGVIGTITSTRSYEDDYIRSKSIRRIEVDGSWYIISVVKEGTKEESLEEEEEEEEED